MLWKNKRDAQGHVPYRAWCKLGVRRVGAATCRPPKYTPHSAEPQTVHGFKNTRHAPRATLFTKEGQGRAGHVGTTVPGRPWMFRALFHPGCCGKPKGPGGGMDGPLWTAAPTGDDAYLGAVYKIRLGQENTCPFGRRFVNTQDNFQGQPAALCVI